MSTTKSSVWARAAAAGTFGGRCVPASGGYGRGFLLLNGAVWHRVADGGALVPLPDVIRLWRDGVNDMKIVHVV